MGRVIIGVLLKCGKNVNSHSMRESRGVGILGPDTPTLCME